LGRIDPTQYVFGESFSLQMIEMPVETLITAQKVSGNKVHGLVIGSA
jgi:hypothetical protein